ncbi:MAG: imidazolonepropionase [Bacilli bacterium]
MKRVALLIDNIGLLWTMSAGSEQEDARAFCGREQMRQVGAMENAAVAVDGEGRIAAVGKTRTVRDLADADTVVVDAQGSFACPGFVDPHTHLVHGGSREAELPLRLAGAGYLDILRAGGGIMKTVRDTRASDPAELFAKASASLGRMRSFGVTAVEAKTGYGLELDTERKQLAVANALAKALPNTLVQTALPAHAVPPSRMADRDKFVEEIARMLPVLHSEGAEFADAFVEEGVFTAAEGRYILLAARRIGMKLKIHADEMASCGGAELAAEVGAVSADHLLSASDGGLLQMAQAGVVAVCLPGTSFYLQKRPARARFMIDEAGLAVAVASDYNPGSSPSENFGLTMSLSLLTLGMSPEEVFVAATRNAAAAVDRAGELGVLRPGRRADLVIFDAPNPAYVLTHYGVSHVRSVYVKGQRVYG